MKFLVLITKKKNRQKQYQKTHKSRSFFGLAHSLERWCQGQFSTISVASIHGCKMAAAATKLPAQWPRKGIARDEEEKGKCSCFFSHCLLILPSLPFSLSLSSPFPSLPPPLLSPSPSLSLSPYKGRECSQKPPVGFSSFICSSGSSGNHWKCRLGWLRSSQWIICGWGRERRWGE